MAKFEHGEIVKFRTGGLGMTVVVGPYDTVTVPPHVNCVWMDAHGAVQRAAIPEIALKSLSKEESDQ